MEDTLYRACLIFALPVMSIIALFSLIFWRGKQRKQLAVIAAIFLIALILLACGYSVLNEFGLVWRVFPRNVLLATVMISGIVGDMFLLIGVLSREMPELAPVLRVTFKLVTLACASLLLYFALMVSFILLVFSIGSRDRVIEYRGELVVEVDESFLDPWYGYYSYHGPLVRGNEPLYSGPEPMVDWE